MIKPVLHFYDISQDVVAFSTTRQGGYSEGNYGQFNINRYCGDRAEAIMQNRQALCQLLQIDDRHLLMPHQVHLTEIAIIDETFLCLGDDERQQQLEGVDAVMTDNDGVCIGVSTADCIPVLLYDSVHHAVCAIHAGWRGTVARIVVFSRLGIRKIRLTGGEPLLRRNLSSLIRRLKELPKIEQVTLTTNGVLLKTLARELIAAGLKPEHIRMSDICTYKMHDMFFSARRLGINSGRIFTAIMLK